MGLCDSDGMRGKLIWCSVGSLIRVGDHGLTNPMRYTAIVRIPWLDLRTLETEEGFHCRPCFKVGSMTEGRYVPGFFVERDINWRRKYTAETFDEHIKAMVQPHHLRHEFVQYCHDRFKRYIVREDEAKV